VNASPETVYAHAGAIAAQIVGYVVAFVPSFRPEERGAIAVGGIVLSAVILIANAIRSKPVSETDAKAAEVAVAGALSKVDLNTVVRGELGKILTGSKPVAVAQTHDYPPAA
jgi:hypothetical protein